MEHKLPPLPYDKEALIPHLSAESFDYHHDKHHQTYVTKLNLLIKDTPYEEMALEDIVKQAPPGALYNNAAQVWNHTFFWNCLKPQGGGTPSGPLLDAIISRWNSFDAFTAEFHEFATGNFGSGWTWLVKKPGGTLHITNMGPAGNPLTTGDQPILCVDVWEHAYYIDYRNERPAFVKVFLDKLVNWSFAEANFD